MFREIRHGPAPDPDGDEGPAEPPESTARPDLILAY